MNLSDPEPLEDCARYIRDAHTRPHPRYEFWSALADYMEMDAGELRDAGGLLLQCDSPAGITRMQCLAEALRKAAS